MPRSFQAIAVLLAALWLPATMHCSFENLGWSALFGCPASTADHAEKDDCSGDACQTLESGNFAFSKSEFAFSAVALPPCYEDPFGLLTVSPPEPAPELFPVRQDEALPLQRTWQFAFRTAAPPRAPDALNT